VTGVGEELGLGPVQFREPFVKASQFLGLTSHLFFSQLALGEFSSLGEKVLDLAGLAQDGL
jgi:hypothetical protein